MDRLSVAAMSRHVGGWAGSAHMLAGPFLEPSWPWFLYIPLSLALIPHPWCGLECPHPLGTALKQAADLRRLITLLPAACGLEVEPPTETSHSVSNTWDLSVHLKEASEWHLPHLLGGVSRVVSSEVTMAASSAGVGAQLPGASRAAACGNVQHNGKGR